MDKDLEMDQIWESGKIFKALETMIMVITILGKRQCRSFNR
jgi:hypothetical protein